MCVGFLRVGIQMQELEALIKMVHCARGSPVNRQMNKNLYNLIIQRISLHQRHHRSDRHPRPLFVALSSSTPSVAAWHG